MQNSWLELLAVFAVVAIVYSLVGMATSIAKLTKHVESALAAHADRLETYDQGPKLERIASQIGGLAHHFRVQRAEILVARAALKSAQGEHLTDEELAAVEEQAQRTRTEKWLRERLAGGGTENPPVDRPGNA